MKITFKTKLHVQQWDGNGPTYEVGQTYDLESSYAHKYVRKGYAEFAVAEPIKAAELPMAEAQPEPADIRKDAAPAESHFSQGEAAASFTTPSTDDPAPDFRTSRKRR